MNRPNILWYCTDQQCFDTIGALENPRVQTLGLDFVFDPKTNPPPFTMAVWAVFSRQLPAVPMGSDWSRSAEVPSST